MFDKDTLLILGAGASKPFGYPLGEDLILDIVANIENDSILWPHPQGMPYYSNREKKLEGCGYKFDQMDPLLIPQKHGNSNLNEFGEKSEIYIIEKVDDPNFRQLFSCRLSAIQEFSALSKALTDFNPVSIDAFIRDNKSHKNAANIMIIYSLLKKESKSTFLLNNNPERDNWYSYLLNDILSGCNKAKDLLKNKLEVITFNYDLSLEYWLHTKLKTTESFNETAIQYLEELCIKHMYGELYSTENVAKDYGMYFSGEDDNSDRPECLNFRRFIKASNEKSRIKLISDVPKSTDFKKIQAMIKRAEKIIIIGFGFDRDNLNNLEFPKTIKDYKNFLSGKTLCYMDYEGKMNGLESQFEEIRRLIRPDIKFEIFGIKAGKLKNPFHYNILRSTATSIVDAYKNDFKIFLSE